MDGWMNVFWLALDRRLGERVEGKRRKRERVLSLGTTTMFSVRSCPAAAHFSLWVWLMMLFLLLLMLVLLLLLLLLLSMWVCCR